MSRAHPSSWLSSVMTGLVSQPETTMNTSDAEGGISLGAQEDEARARADERADDDARAKRWAHFGDVLADFLTQDWLDEVAHAYRWRHRADLLGPGRLAWHIQQFAETEGYDGVLNAIARMMREQGEGQSCR